MDKIAPYWKAVIGFIAPGAVVIGSSVLEGSAGNESITPGEWVTAVVACVVTGAGVLAKGNGERPNPAGGAGDEPEPQHRADV